MKSSSNSKTATPSLLAVFALGCFALCPMVQAVVPPPDGAYPNLNTAEGQNALLSLDTSTGIGNTAVGWFSLQATTAGNLNTAVGAGALLLTRADENTATGAGALLNSSGGFGNTANGAFALFSDTDGDFNTASGDGALFSNTTGNANTALGINAGSAVTTASNVICIGADVHGADVNDSCFIGNIRDALVAPDAEPVLIDSAGKLGTTSGSSRRFKDHIKLMGEASEAIFALKPVTFHYKDDNKNTPQFGLIAEDVAEVNSDLAVRDKNGKIYTVRYDAVNAMLLNEFLKEHRKVGQLEATVAQQQNGMAALTARLDHQATQIEKVSARIAVDRSAPHTVLNNP
ncbi:MAG TPA: tail fiber domain-containing protein [Candidatus Udaeobacter sp.]|nr:tail fiber domain-containing protein [Candidatus Udaeobacter sp.]